MSPSLAGPSTPTIRVAGLFAGIGGIELGLEQTSRFSSTLLCEIDDGARAVLGARFPGAEIAEDVAALEELPEVDLLTAGFPCQDLSQAGGKRGIGGDKSGLVEHVFRLLARAKDDNTLPPVVVMENVSYMLRLGRGGAMTYLVDRLERLGYRWAYRVVDARAFGIPQRRQRVLLLASTEMDPCRTLLSSHVAEADVDHIGPVDRRSAYGFYWTEGRRGLGWAKNAVPTLKGGSRLGIPSPPAVWLPQVGYFGTPVLEDAERLQGFPAGWSRAADDVYAKPRRQRWTLVGNAVCVPMATWLGRRILAGLDGTDEGIARQAALGTRWPIAAHGGPVGRFGVPASLRPVQEPYVPLLEFLAHPMAQLSERAARGFLSRARSGSLRFSEGFLESLASFVDGFPHYAEVRESLSAPTPSGTAACPGA